MNAEKLEDFAKFLIAGMDMPGNDRDKKWPGLTAEENEIYRKWQKSTDYGKRYCKTDPMVQSWDSARHHWFVLPKMREILKVTPA